MITHAYTLVFSRELPDSRAVRYLKRELRQIFDTDQVSTSDNRKFSFVTTIAEEKVERVVETFGREHRRLFVIDGQSIHEVRSLSEFEKAKEQASSSK